MQNATTIEIFILTYNRLPYLKSAINSALNQSIKNLKITIMDNCSTDGTEDYVKSLQKNIPIYITISKEKMCLSWIIFCLSNC